MKRHSILYWILEYNISKQNRIIHHKTFRTIGIKMILLFMFIKNNWNCCNRQAKNLFYYIKAQKIDNLLFSVGGENLTEIKNLLQGKLIYRREDVAYSFCCKAEYMHPRSKIEDGRCNNRICKRIVFIVLAPARTIDREQEINKNWMMKRCSKTIDRKRLSQFSWDGTE